MESGRCRATRSAAISQVNGIWTNTASLTCTISGGSTTTTIAAGQWTYLGTFYATANGQTGMAFKPIAASGGTNNVLGLWNAYNRVRIVSLNQDNNSSWTYATATNRPADNSTSNRISWVDGLAQSSVEMTYQVRMWNGTNFDGAVIGVSLDSTTATPTVNPFVQQQNANNRIWAPTTEVFPPQLGLHYGQAIEWVNAGTETFEGSGEGLHIDLDM